MRVYDDHLRRVPIINQENAIEPAAAIGNDGWLAEAETRRLVGIAIVTVLVGLGGEPPHRFAKDA